jgi:excisionase family DNA binding protein
MASKSIANPTTPPAPDLSLTQSAATLGITERTATRWIASGQLPARKVGGQWRIRRDDVQTLLDGGAA